MNDIEDITINWKTYKFEISIICWLSNVDEALVDEDSIWLTNEMSISICLDVVESVEKEETDRQEVGVDGACDGNSSVNIFRNGRKMKMWR